MLPRKKKVEGNFIVGGRGSKWLTKFMGLAVHRRIILGKYTLNSCLGCTTIIDKGTEDIFLGKKKKRQWYLLHRKKKKERRGNLKKPMCTCIWAFLSIKKKFILLSFLSILVGLERKHMSHTIYFSSFLPNQTHSKKVLLSIFSLKFSIHTISPNKYTICAWGGVNSAIRLLTQSIYLLPNVFSP